MMKWFQRLSRKPQSAEAAADDCDNKDRAHEEKENLKRREREVERRIDSLEHLADALRQANR